MKVTFTPLGAARATLAYYLRDAGYAPPADAGPQRRAHYYARQVAEHRRASAWMGRGAEALGLRGPVSERAFEQVLRGEVPGTGLVLRRHRDGAQEHRCAWDMTFSVPKSLSVAWGVQGDRRIRAAFRRAVHEAMAVAEARYLETRDHDPETGRRARVRAEGLVAAAFVHTSNRNDEPQLHAHVIVVNMTRLRGEWRSVEPTALARHARLLGAIAGSRLAGALRALGYGIESRPAGRAPSFEIAGYSRGLLARYSSRRREIVRHIMRSGRRYSARAAQAAALATRRKKSGLRATALREQWRAEVEANAALAEALGRARRESRLAGLEADAPVPSAREAVREAVAHLEERATVLRERDVLATALMLHPGRHGLDALRAALEGRCRERQLLEARAYRGGRAFVTAREFAGERALVAWMRAARGTGDALASEAAVEARLGATRLTAGQKAAARLILLSAHRAVAVQGAAGTGKTALMREVVGLAGDVPVFGLAPSAAAARVLGHEAGIETRTIDWCLTRFADLESGHAPPKTRALARALCGDGVLIVDEASMVSTGQLRALTRLASAIGVARTVLCGDHRQLQSVRPGAPFRLLQHAGMPTAHMEELVRQRHPVLRQAVRDALSGRPARALTYLGERLEEVAPEALAERAGREYLTLPPHERARTLLVAPTNAQRRDICAVVREGLTEEAVLHGPVLTLDRLIDLHCTGAEKKRLATYQPGDEVVFVQDLPQYRVLDGEACTVTGTEGARVRLRHPDGRPRHIDPGGPIRHRIKLCESAPIEVRAGERIRWTHNDKRRGLLNGETATVEAIGSKRVRLRTADGRALALARDDRQLRHVDHAYAATAHAAQGSTCERVIAVLDADPAPLTNQLTFYVQISRAREEVRVFTDDREQLIETLEAQSGERMSAHDALGAVPGGGGAAARALRRRYERLRHEWRRMRRQGRAEQRAPFHTRGYAAMHERVAELGRAQGLPEHVRRFVADWTGEHAESEARERDIEAVVEDAQQSARAHEREHPPRWDAHDEERLHRARRVHADPAAYGPHLDAHEDRRARFERAFDALETRERRARAQSRAEVPRESAMDSVHAAVPPDAVVQAPAPEALRPKPGTGRERTAGVDVPAEGEAAEAGSPPTPAPDPEHPAPQRPGAPDPQHQERERREVARRRKAAERERRAREALHTLAVQLEETAAKRRALDAHEREAGRPDPEAQERLRQAAEPLARQARAVLEGVDASSAQLEALPEVRHRIREGRRADARAARSAPGAEPGRGPATRPNPAWSRTGDGSALGEQRARLAARLEARGNPGAALRAQPLGEHLAHVAPTLVCQAKQRPVEQHLDRTEQVEQPALCRCAVAEQLRLDARHPFEQRALLGLVEHQTRRRTPCRRGRGRAGALHQVGRYRHPGLQGACPNLPPLRIGARDGVRGRRRTAGARPRRRRARALPGRRLAEQPHRLEQRDLRARQPFEQRAGAALQRPDALIERPLLGLAERKRVVKEAALALGAGRARRLEGARHHEARDRHLERLRALHHHRPLRARAVHAAHPRTPHRHPSPALVPAGHSGARGEQAPPIRG